MVIPKKKVYLQILFDNNNLVLQISYKVGSNICCLKMLKNWFNLDPKVRSRSCRMRKKRKRQRIGGNSTREMLTSSFTLFLSHCTLLLPPTYRSLLLPLFLSPSLSPSDEHEIYMFTRFHGNFLFDSQPLHFISYHLCPSFLSSSSFPLSHSRLSHLRQRRRWQTAIFVWQAANASREFCFRLKDLDDSLLIRSSIYALNPRSGQTRLNTISLIYPSSFLLYIWKWPCNYPVNVK